MTKTFIHVADAALSGLPLGLRGDQALVGSRPVLLPVLGAQQLAANTRFRFDADAVLNRDALGALPVSDGGFFEAKNRGQLFLAPGNLGGFFYGDCWFHVVEYRTARHLPQYPNHQKYSMAIHSFVITRPSFMLSA